MKHFITLVCAIGLFTLMGMSFFSCGSNRIEDLEKISEYHKLTLKETPSGLETDGKGQGGSCVDLYIDYSDCMTTANESEYYRNVQPAIIACAPNYYSIKGDQIKFESNNKDQIYQLMNNITNVDYSAIKSAVDSIVSKNHEAILITDGEYYHKGIGADLKNPYLADEFKEWLTKGRDIYIYSEPYEAGMYTKKRYYMLFTDHRLNNNIHEIFLRNAPKNDDVKMVHLYSGIPSVDIPENGVTFHDEAYIVAEDGEKNKELKFESHLMDGTWSNIRDCILNAVDENGKPIKGGDYFLKGLKINIAKEDAYLPEELELKCYEISDDYAKTDGKATGKLDKELKNVFVLDEKAWKKGEIVVKIDPSFDGKTLTGTLGNLIRMDIRVKKSKDNFSNNETISENFKFDSPYGFNTSIYESLKQTLNDPSISPERNGDPILYTIYLSTYENK